MARETPYARTASPRLPICGKPDAPRPLSTNTNSSDLPISFSLLIILEASLSIQVPFPMISLLISPTTPLIHMVRSIRIQISCNTVSYLLRL